jgi:predicted Zn-dependent protease
VTRLLALTAALIAVLPVAAHPDIDEALARLDGLISADPENAALYLQRGELQVKHNNLIAADADFQTAGKKSADLRGLDRARGELALAKGQDQQARLLLDRALALNPDDAEALVMRSRAHAALGDRASALADLNAALEKIPTPPPDLFLSRAALITEPAEAIRGLDEGIDRIGAAPSLILRALVLEEAAGRIDAALARIDKVIAQSEANETWLKLRGDLLARAGREREARLAYTAARRAIASLPEWLQKSVENQSMAAELDHLLFSSSQTSP